MEWMRLCSPSTPGRVGSAPQQLLGLPHLNAPNLTLSSSSLRWLQSTVAFWASVASHLLPRLALLPGRHPKTWVMTFCISPSGPSLKLFSLIHGCFTSSPPPVTPELWGHSSVCCCPSVLIDSWLPFTRLWASSGFFCRAVFQFHPFSVSFNLSFKSGSSLDGAAVSAKQCLTTAKQPRTPPFLHQS